MKKSLLLGAALMMAAGASAQIEPGVYYIKNVETGMFLNEGWSWGTHAVAKAYPCAFEVTADGDAYIFKSAYGFIKPENGEYYMDGGQEIKTYLEPNGEYYNIKTGDAYLTIDEEKNYLTDEWLASLDMCETLLYTVKQAAEPDGNKSAWQVISREEMVTALSEASAQNPVEASFFLNAGQIEVNATNNISSWTYEKHYTKALVPEEADEEVNLPDPYYLNTFEAEDLNGATIVGGGEIKDVEGAYGKVFSNAMNGMRENYLLLPEDALAHSAETEALTIGVWINRGNETESGHYMWSPLFMAYGSAPSENNENSWPMLACQYRGVLQVNCNGWSDYKDEQNVKGANAVYHNETDWIADGNWHYYAATFTPTTAKVYFDGGLINEWVIDGVDNTAAGLFSNGADLKYICLGGNQAWNWADPDPGFWFDDLALYNTELSKEQIKKIIALKNAEAQTKAEGDDVETFDSAEITLPWGGWFGHDEWCNKTTYAWCRNDAMEENEGGTNYKYTPIAGTDVVYQNVEGMPAGYYTATYRVVNQSNTPLVVKFNDAEGAPFEYEEEDLWYNSAQTSLAHNTKSVEFEVGEDGKLSLRMEKTIDPAQQNRFAFKSFSLLYTGKEQSGVANIAADENAPVEYFNMQGIRVANPTNGIYIKRQGKKASKVLVK